MPFGLRSTGAFEGTTLEDCVTYSLHKTRTPSSHRGRPTPFVVSRSGLSAFYAAGIIHRDSRPATCSPAGFGETEIFKISSDRLRCGVSDGSRVLASRLNLGTLGYSRPNLPTRRRARTRSVTVV